ncbi:hypothetical protein ACFX1X_021036 [Malus domestica]
MATVSGTSPPLLCCTNRRAGFSNKPSLRSRPQDPILHAKAVFWGIGLPNAAFTTARNPRKDSKLKPHMRTTAQNGCFRLLHGLLRESTFCGFFSFLMLLETQCGELVWIQ